MIVTFTKKFEKSFDKIKDERFRKAITMMVRATQKATSTPEIPNLKKMTGHKTAFRIRIKDYRIGVFIEGEKVEFAALAHRKDIYKLFP